MSLLTYYYRHPTVIMFINPRLRACAARVVGRCVCVCVCVCVRDCVRDCVCVRLSTVFLGNRRATLSVKRGHIIK